MVFQYSSLPSSVASPVKDIKSMGKGTQSNEAPPDKSIFKSKGELDS